MNKPCPFCGSKKLRDGKWVGEAQGFVRCLKCEAEAPATVWNQRVETVSA